MSRIDTNEMHKIIVELKNNNMDVFDEFYELTKRQVYVSILSIVKNKTISDDIMQETYMRFLNNIHKYKEKTNVVAFIVTIARNLAINEHYLTIKQMLSKEKVKYEILQNDDGTYENKMIIQAFFNSELDLQYTIYFNKTKVLKHEDNEELFNIEGIIIIDNKTYQVFGEIESEEDEIETKIKVVTGENEYFVIEQEKEVDEEEFVYTSYINNKKQNEYSISYEVEDNEIEIKIEMLTNGKVEKLVSKIENNEIILKVNFTTYQGKVEVIDDVSSIKYYFIEENTTIEKKLIKK